MVAARKRDRALQSGQRVKAARLFLQMSQTQVARACDITEGAYRAIELGRSEPRTKTLRALCEVLGRSADWILFGIDTRRDRAA